MMKLFNVDYVIVFYCDYACREIIQEIKENFCLISVEINEDKEKAEKCSEIIKK